MKIRTYSDLVRLETFEERFEYLSLRGVVAESTFGFDRWMNQRFYRSREWKQMRSYVIVRDRGCDLGVLGREIHADLLVHHMNPVTTRAVYENENWILDPEYLVTTSKRTHNAIHYGDADLLPKTLVERRSGDTRLW